eukprot:TRINITY_DN11806_c2_g1_i2.p1 TRINITY_DN11806_c2_g1~~TRINITY_DN11806_c2_g1_i2.p1  ORF type:complete len:111 (+),score=7.64 TRINITY_DN11806_c2_g1_i2:1-333(+)
MYMYMYMYRERGTLQNAPLKMGRFCSYRTSNEKQPSNCEESKKERAIYPSFITPSFLGVLLKRLGENMRRETVLHYIFFLPFFILVITAGSCGSNYLYLEIRRYVITIHE